MKIWHRFGFLYIFFGVLSVVVVLFLSLNTLLYYTMQLFKWLLMIGVLYFIYLSGSKLVYDVWFITLIYIISYTNVPTYLVQLGMYISAPLIFSKC